MKYKKFARFGMKFGMSEREWLQLKHATKSRLSEAASERKMITYSGLCQSLPEYKLDPHGTPLAELLGEISSEEHKAGRGMLSVIVVHKLGDMEPGRGFYKLAEQLGIAFSDRQKFWIDELHKVHGYWSNNL